MKKTRKILQLWVKGAISIAFFAVLLSFIRTNTLVAVFTNIHWLYFFTSFLVTFAMLCVSCSKWRSVLILKDKTLGFRELLRIYFIGYFFSNLLPSTIGGDVARLYYAGKLIENQSYAAISVFVERFSGIVFLFFLVAVAPLFQWELYANPYLFVPAGTGLCCLGICFWVWQARNPFAIPNRLAEFIFRHLQRLAKKPFASFLKRPISSLEALYRKTLEGVQKVKNEMVVATDAVKTNKEFVGRLFFLTALFYLLSWVNVYTAFLAFNVKVNFLAICALVPAIMLVAHVPVTLLGNLGYFESVFVFYFLLVGVSGAETLAMGLLLRLKMLAMGAVGFIVYLFYRQKLRLPLE